MVLVFTKFVIDFKSTQDSGVTLVIYGEGGAYLSHRILKEL